MPTVGDICRQFGPKYRRLHGSAMLPRHRKALADLAKCRHPTAGGHLVGCLQCRRMHFRWHSCGNRNCPQCGGAATDKWLQRRAEVLLPVPHHMLVFTLPAELRQLVRRYQKILLPALMRTSAEAVIQLARDPRHLGAEVGVISVLHTWGRNLAWHPHAHLLVPGGGVNKDGEWVPARKNFFLPTRLLARLFRGKFMAELKRLLPGVTVPQSVWDKEWVVYSKPVVKPRYVLDYLGRYLFKTAISNQRILRVGQDDVTFAYVDHRDGKRKTMTLPGTEFLRRFLQHVPPRGMHRVRYYGMAHPKRAAIMDSVRRRLLESGCEPNEPIEPRQCLPTCPHCHSDNLIILHDVPPIQRGPPHLLLYLPGGIP